MEKPGNAEVQEGQDKLRAFQQKKLDESVDYIALNASLSLLQNHKIKLEKDIIELNNFKDSIKHSKNIKQLSNLVTKNTDYLNEINYKGSVIKCPVINWELNYGIRNIDNVVSLSDREKDRDKKSKIDDEYEILKRDKLFKDI